MTDLIIAFLKSYLLIIATGAMTSLILYYFSPRLELAKGLRGNMNPVKTVLGRWMAFTLWQHGKFSVKSIWPLVLGLQLFGLHFLQMPTHSRYGLELEYFFITCLLSLSLLLSLLGIQLKLGSRHPRVTQLAGFTLMSVVALMFVSNSLESHSQNPARIFLTFVFFILMAKNFVVWSDEKEVPKIVGRLFILNWASLAYHATFGGLALGELSFVLELFVVTALVSLSMLMGRSFQDFKILAQMRLSTIQLSVLALVIGIGLMVVPL